MLVAAAMTPSHDPRFSDNWAAAREKDNERRAMTEARWNEEEAARQVASRKAYEGSLRRRTFSPSSRMPPDGPLDTVYSNRQMAPLTNFLRRLPLSPERLLCLR